MYTVLSVCSMFMRCRASVLFLSLSFFIHHLLLLLSFGPSLAHSILLQYILCTATFHGMIFSLLFPSHVFCICLCHFRSGLLHTLSLSIYLFILLISFRPFSSFFSCTTSSHSHLFTHSLTVYLLFPLSCLPTPSTRRRVSHINVHMYIYIVYLLLYSLVLLLNLPMNVYQVCTNAFQIE